MEDPLSPKVHERATGPWYVERQSVPTAFIVASGGLRATCEVLEGLEVRPDAMKRALGASDSLIVAEAVMMELAPSMGRQKAHDLEPVNCLGSAPEMVRRLLSSRGS